MLASIGGGHDFDNGRQVAAWIGLVPGQYSSGDKQDRFSCWARSLQERSGYWRTVIAVAAKNVRLALASPARTTGWAYPHQLLAYSLPTARKNAFISPADLK